MTTPQNDLVADAPQDPDGPLAFTAGNGDYGYAGGIGIAESAMDAFNGIKDGNWVEGGLGMLGFAAEAAAAAIDPFGWLMSSVASFLMEHVQPLKDMLDSLAGDPPVIQSYSETWGNVAKALEEIQADFANAVKNGTSGWEGAAADAYRQSSGEQAEAISGAATVSGAISTVVMIMGEVVAFVRETVRDLIADLVGKLISWVLETVFSLGFGTPVVVAQAVAAIGKWAKKISDLIDKLISTIKKVSPLLGKLAEVFTKIVKVLGKLAGKATGLDVINTRNVIPGGFTHHGGVDTPGAGGGGSPGSGGSGSGDSGSGSGSGSGSTGDSGGSTGTDGSGSPGGPSGGGPDTTTGGSGGGNGSGSPGGSGSSGGSGGGSPSGDGGPSSVRSTGGDGPAPSHSGSGAQTTASPMFSRVDTPAGGHGGGADAPSGSGSGGGSGSVPVGGGSHGGSPGGPGSPSGTTSPHVPDTTTGASGTAAAPPRPDTPAGSPGSPGSPYRDNPGGGGQLGGPQHGAPMGGMPPGGAGGGTGSGAPGGRPSGGWTGTPGSPAPPTPRAPETPGSYGRPDGPRPDGPGGRGPTHTGPSGGPSSPASTPHAPAGRPDGLGPSGPSHHSGPSHAGPGPAGHGPGSQGPGGRGPGGPGGQHPGGPGGPGPRGPVGPHPTTPHPGGPVPRGYAGPPGGPAPNTHGGFGPGGYGPGGPSHGPGGPGRPGPSGHGPEGTPPNRPRPDGPEGHRRDPHGRDSGQDGQRPEQHPQDSPQDRHDADSRPDQDGIGTHDQDRPSPDEVNQRHSEGTPAGSSFHHGDPEMGDLPQRVRPDPDGRYTVDVHVTPDGRARIGDHTYSPEEFADILRRNGDYDGRPIRLIGCDAGSNDFAQRLSRELDTPVMAPSKPAWTDSNGRVFSSDYEIGPDGKPQPKIPPNGQWDTHHPDGSTARTSDDGFTPGTADADKRDLDGDDAVDRGRRDISDKPVAIEERQPPASTKEKINDEDYRRKYYDGPDSNGEYSRKNADQTDHNGERVEKIKEDPSKPEGERFEENTGNCVPAEYRDDIPEVEHKATTRQQENAQQLIDERAAANDRARTAEGDYQGAQQKGTVTEEIERERSEAHRERTEYGEDLGEHAARDAIADSYPTKDYEVKELPDPEIHGDNTRPGGDKPGSGRFDQIYQVTDRATGETRYVVVEAKGPNAELGTRKGVDGVSYEQGHPKYVDSILKNMRDNGTPAEKALAQELQDAKALGELDYSVAKARVRDEPVLDADGNTVPDPENPDKVKKQPVYGGYNLKHFDLSITT